MLEMRKKLLGSSQNVTTPEGVSDNQKTNDASDYIT